MVQQLKTIVALLQVMSAQLDALICPEEVDDPDDKPVSLDAAGPRRPAPAHL